MLGSSDLPRRQRGITIKMIIVPEVASRARSKGWENGMSVKETICHFQSGPHDRMCARVLVLIAAVNASNFTRLISLSLAGAGPFQERGWTRGNERKGKKREQRDDNFAIQIRDLSDNSSPPPLSCASLSRRSRSARRLIKFSGNQICHSAVRF